MPPTYRHVPAGQAVRVGDHAVKVATVRSDPDVALLAIWPVAPKCPTCGASHVGVHTRYFRVVEADTDKQIGLDANARHA